MRKLIYAAIAVIIVTACNNRKESYQLSGKIDGIQDTLVKLSRVTEGEYVTIDSTRTKEGTFLFTGKLAYPEVLFITLPGKRPAAVFMENNEINLTAHVDSLNKMSVTGSSFQDKYDAYKKSLEPLYDKEEALYTRYREARNNDDQELVTKIENEWETLDEEFLDARKSYVLDHAGSYLSPYIIWREMAYDLSLEELENLTNALDSSLNNYPYTNMLEDRIETLRRTAEGQPAIDFTMNDTLGNPVQLSSLYGNYLLVDFWAAWCPPCRAENPNLVKQYQKYHKKGFDIIGVSFDRSREDWLKAIEKDNLTWHHVSDLSYWDNKAGKLYGIRSIPSNVLLDPNGIIIAKNLRGEKLQEKLEELLD